MKSCQDLRSERSSRDKSLPESSHGSLSLPSGKPAHESKYFKHCSRKGDIPRSMCPVHTAYPVEVDGKVHRARQTPPRVTTGHYKCPCPRSRSELSLVEEIAKCLQGLKVEWKSGLNPTSPLPEVLGLR